MTLFVFLGAEAISLESRYTLTSPIFQQLPKFMVRLPDPLRTVLNVPTLFHALQPYQLSWAPHILPTLEISCGIFLPHPMLKFHPFFAISLGFPSLLSFWFSEHAEPTKILANWNNQLIYNNKLTHYISYNCLITYYELYNLPPVPKGGGDRFVSGRCPELGAMRKSSFPEYWSMRPIRNYEQNQIRWIKEHYFITFNILIKAIILFLPIKTKIIVKSFILLVVSPRKTRPYPNKNLTWTELG